MHSCILYFHKPRLILCIPCKLLANNSHSDSDETCYCDFIFKQRGLLDQINSLSSPVQFTNLSYGAFYW